MKAARLDEIVVLLRQRGVLDTKAIAQAVSASTATVRRDLEMLEQANRIERVFGGARIRADVDAPFEQVLTDNAAAKDRIARAAASTIADGQTVILDIGTTAYSVATHLVGRPLTVVTSSLAVYDTLAGSEATSLILLGGQVNRAYRCTQGHTVVEALGDIHADAAFIGCSGITATGTVRDTDAAQIEVKRAMLNAASRVTVLADASKFPGVGAFSAVSLTAVDALITDADVPADLAALCADHETEVTHL